MRARLWPAQIAAQCVMDDAHDSGIGWSVAGRTHRDGSFICVLVYLRSG
jgi:hypothetical protein